MQNLKSKKILVVEDDIVFSLAVCGQLVSVGFNDEFIYRTDRVEEFAEIAENFQPEIILLDLNITDSSGIVTFEKSNESFPLATGGRGVCGTPWFCLRRRPNGNLRF